MKIWCVDHAGLGWRISSDVYFTKEEAQAAYDKYDIDGFYRKMYQVEDIWGWCGRHFYEVISEVVASRDDGNDSTYIYGMCNEIREAAKHCGLEHCSIDGFWADEQGFVLSVAWISEDKLFHRTYHFNARDDFYEYPTIVERRSKWVK